MTVAQCIQSQAEVQSPITCATRAMRGRCPCTSKISKTKSGVSYSRRSHFVRRRPSLSVPFSRLCDRFRLSFTLRQRGVTTCVLVARSPVARQRSPGWSHRCCLALRSSGGYSRRRNNSRRPVSTSDPGLVVPVAIIGNSSAQVIVLQRASSILV